MNNTIERYNDQSYKDWYDTYLRQFDSEEKAVALERLITMPVKFFGGRFLLILLVSIIVSVGASVLCAYFICDPSGDKWLGWMSSLFQNASMGFLTGLVLTLYTMNRDRSLEYYREVLLSLELRVRRYQAAYDSITIIPYDNSEEYNGMNRNRYLLHILSNLNCTMIEFMEKFSSILKCGEKGKLDEDNKYLMELWCSLDGLMVNNDNMMPCEKVEKGYSIVRRTLNTIYSYVEVLRAKVFEIKYGKSTFVESKIQREAKKKLAERAKLRRRNK